MLISADCISHPIWKSGSGTLRMRQKSCERLDHMAMIGATPEQYGLRIQSHEILLVTAPNKMHHAREFKVSFQGEGKIQTVFFADEAGIARTRKGLPRFCRTLAARLKSARPARGRGESGTPGRTDSCGRRCPEWRLPACWRIAVPR